MKVIIADSNELIRLGVRAALKNDAVAEIVGEARSNQELIDIIDNFGSDLVIIDYTSDGFDIDVLPKILAKHKDVKVLAITPEQSANTLIDALKSGVMSYVKKDCSLAEIIEAVKETSNGNKFFCGQILETIKEADLDVDDIDFDALSCEPVVLSKREIEVIVLIAEGFTNGAIAKKLFLSNHTINTHRKNILAKLGVKNTAGIVMYAVKTNLISPNKFLFSGESVN